VRQNTLPVDGSKLEPENERVLTILMGGEPRVNRTGSSHLLHDQYVDKEENLKVVDVLMTWLTDPEFKLNAIEAGVWCHFCVSFVVLWLEVLLACCVLKSLLLWFETFSTWLLTRFMLQCVAVS
jgi:hypothetical protein